ncbi:UDP-N-acetylmuramate dehydrogenase [Skermanella sp. TT6]|uniref:UDP-N-acetylenolpyruvoylglucosamine reductase n=1 Tax=Skermanella cutis TaxID=2775420 RepID=A0ABX7B515_9PROT|nr:UDP-N-acetylmuramate dehydrogenase [Skermanella sp. TT6]QQP88215.1 UDP-N-acetylmuramate dehydrogenase [Skermanella sp. TT6]
MPDPFAGLTTQRPIRCDEPLHPYTTWKVGGTARWFWEPDGDALPDVLRRCRETGISVRVLGRGSNVLIDSRGFDGLVICMRNSFTDIEVEGSTVRAGAGVQLPKLARTASRAGIAGFGFLVGIPGSVGGGTAMNAGLTAKGRREISTILEAATVVDLTSGETATVPAAELGLDYRQSNLAEKRWMVTEVVFRGPSLGDPKELMSEIRSHMADRHAKQPLDRRTAGSTFKQPAGGAAAGWYIENAGLKGCRIGSAVISHKHANWIENTGAATSDDIRNLVEHVQESVASRFDVALDPEVTFLI